MALNRRDSEDDRVGRSLANATDGRTKARHDDLGNRNAPSVADEISRIARRCASLPVLDERSADEILGYDHHGAPT